MAGKHCHWELQKEELLSLQSIYCAPGECTLLFPQTLSFDDLESLQEPPSSLTMELRLSVPVGHSREDRPVELIATITLPTAYPKEALIVTLTSPNLTKLALELLTSKALEHAQGIKPDPSVFAVIEKVKDTIIEMVASSPSCLNDAECMETGEFRNSHGDSLQYFHEGFQTGGCEGDATYSHHNLTSHICVIKIDHMRNEQKYLKVLKSWAEELSVGGKVVNAGLHYVYTVLVGEERQLNEFVRRWKTQNVDVDSRGRPCKEKLITILCQDQLSEPPSAYCERSAAESGRDLWSVALEERDRNEEERMKILEAQGKFEGENSVFCVGSQAAGKTTIILRFLDREEPPRPTTALDYTYGRRSRGANLAKEVTHIWELGGGSFLAKLVEIPITTDTISGLSVLLVLDLSKPEELWNTLEVFIKQIRQRVNQVLAELKSSRPALVSQLKQRAWRKFGEDHPDKDLLDPLPVPLAIVGTKYDIFQDIDPERKKVVCRTLRFVAHTNGASLHFFSTHSDALVNRVKQLLNHLAFGGPLSRTMSMDYTKPLLVPAGSDALGQIGPPSLSPADLGKISARKPLELWKQAYCGFFPQVSAQPEVADDPCKDAKYLEPAVDAMRAQKDEDLDRYRRQCEKKARDLARQRGQALARTPRTS